MTWQPKDELASAVALEVLIHGPLGRAELARRLGLAPATLTRISTELIASGLLAEVPEATQRTSGRPTIPLDVVPSSHYFLGIKLTDSALDATVIDLKATPRDSYRVPLESLTPVRVVRAIADLAHLARSSYRIDAIGIAVGGIVNADGTTREVAVRPGQDARGILEAAGVSVHALDRVTVENDATGELAITVSRGPRGPRHTEYRPAPGAPRSRL